MDAADEWEYTRPEGWPDKPLHEYSAAEWRAYALPVVAEHVTGGRLRAAALTPAAGGR